MSRTSYTKVFYIEDVLENIVKLTKKAPAINHLHFVYQDFIAGVPGKILQNLAEELLYWTRVNGWFKMVRHIIPLRIA